jgi:DNA-binding XRE family transcriptional regulator
LGVQGEEARVALQAVHCPPVSMPHVGAGRGERLGGDGASETLSAFAGVFEDYWVRQTGVRHKSLLVAGPRGVSPPARPFLCPTKLLYYKYLQVSTSIYKYVRMFLVNYRAMEVDVAKLQGFRINQGLSQRQLAERAGLSPGAVWNLEKRGSGHPETLKKIADVLGVRPVDLLKKGQ